MFVLLCVHMCVHVYVYICVCACVHVCARACMCMCVCMCVHMCVCMYACVCARACMCMCVRACVCMCVHMCVCMYACVRARACMCMCMCMCVRACVCACMCLHTHMHMYCMCVYMFMFMYMYICPLSDFPSNMQQHIPTTNSSMAPPLQCSTQRPVPAPTPPAAMSSGHLEGGGEPTATEGGGQEGGQGEVPVVPLKCPKCEMSYMSKTGLNGHIAVAHPVELPVRGVCACGGGGHLHSECI